jgi:transposase
MPARFVVVDRNTPMLLPPDLRDWIGEDDLVHFVIEAVERLPLSCFKINHRGTGSAQMHPRVMLSLLIYCYANGIFSSRKIERATYRDVGVRYITGDTHPDHDIICSFRRENFAAITEAFVDLLELAKSLGCSPSVRSARTGPTSKRVQLWIRTSATSEPRRSANN